MATGRKKLQDFFVDAKVPRAKRAEALVLEVGGEVAWVVGHRQDNRFATTESSERVVEVRVVKLGSSDPALPAVGVQHGPVG
jgi:tRNA(Ile)-lysidine synthase